MNNKSQYELGQDFIKNPSFENITAFMGKVNENLYGVNPFEMPEPEDREETEIGSHVEDKYQHLSPQDDIYGE